MGQTNRRRFLAVAAGTVFAGCAGKAANSAGAGGASGLTSRSGSTTANATNRATQTTQGAQTTQATSTIGESASDEQHAKHARSHPTHFEVDIDHPAAMNLGSEPYMGEVPAETGHIIVQFTDISCDVCARFDEQTFPMVYSNLIQSGKVTFVSRDFPHTHPWTHPGTYALDATYERNPQAYWLLKSWFYSHKEHISMDNVYDEVHGFLSEKTDVDADAVEGEMRSGAWKDAAQRDLKAKKAADVTGTPTFFLFKHGKFVTRFQGNQSYAVFKNALQL